MTKDGMTLEEAIGINKRLILDSPDDVQIPYNKALQLGIEALERLKHIRENIVQKHEVWIYKPLPSEEE